MKVISTCVEWYRELTRAGKAGMRCGGPKFEAELWGILNSNVMCLWGNVWIRPILQEKHNHMKADGRFDADRVLASVQAGVYSRDQKEEPVKMWCDASSSLRITQEIGEVYQRLWPKTFTGDEPLHPTG